MLLLLSPAKTLDLESELPSFEVSYPEHEDKMQQILKCCQQLSIDQLASMMKISDKLALLNYERYQNWEMDKKNSETQLHENKIRQAVFAFNGDVYEGLNAYKFTESQLNFAQQHLRILSGLYGLLRPLDCIHPYRLEMGTVLEVSGSKNLYAFWQSYLTEKINQLVEQENGLLNLSSQEYFKVIDRTKITKPIFDVVFLDQKDPNSAYKIISFYAKKARGLMANFIIRNEITDFNQLKQFEDAGYKFDIENSTKTNLFFKRSFFK